MIDWLTMVVPCAHALPIDGGKFMSIGAGGDVEFCTSKFRSVAGSHDCKVRVRTATHMPEPCSYLHVDGNPAKFLQGHNLWGSDDVPGLAVAMLEKLATVPELGLTPTDADRAAWIAGAVQLTRVDVTESFNAGSRAGALAWLRAAFHSASLPFRGRGQMKGDTLYFGKQSRRWSLKLYSKGQEICAPGHAQPAIENLPSALAWAEPVIRAELTLRSLELKRRGLNMVADWLEFDALSSEVTSQLLRPVLAEMTMTTATTLPAEVFDSLTTGQRTAFCAWQAGHDLRQLMSHSGFYRLRALLLPHGIDVTCVQDRESTNVVPLMRVIEAVPMAAPGWAIGTPLFFEPRLRRVA